MITKETRNITISFVSVLTLVMAASLGISASAAANEPEINQTTSSENVVQVSEDMQQDPEVEGQITASMSGNNISQAQATRLIELQGPQFDFMEHVSQTYADTVGGYSLDVKTAVLHVHVTPEFAAVHELMDLAKNLGIPIEFDTTAWSIDALTSASEQLSEQIGSERAAVTPDFEHSTLIVSVQDEDAAQQARVAAASIRPTTVAGVMSRSADMQPSVPMELHISQPTQVGADACTDRFHCGVPLRAGIAVSWNTSSTCSIGFTATAGDGSRWAMTAGHCAGMNTIVRHGEQAIGPIRQGHNFRTSSQYPGVDVERAHITNAYWLSKPRQGAIFYPNGTDNLGKINGYLSSYANLVSGQSLCLGAIHVSSSPCGTFNGFEEHGLGIVKGYDACHGDSGGAWTANLGGRRILYGVHSYSSYDGCLRNNASQSSYFSTIPAIRTFWSKTIGQSMNIDVS